MRRPLRSAPYVRLACYATLLTLTASCSSERAEAFARQQAEQETKRQRSLLDSVLALGGEIPQETLHTFTPREQIEDILLGGKQVVEHKPEGSREVLEEGYYRKVLRTFDLHGYELQEQYTGYLPADVV